MYRLTKFIQFLCIALLVAFSYPAIASEKAVFYIQDAYIDLHTGPGVGYPIFDVVEKGNPITLLKRKTTWYKVLTTDGKQGWVKQSQLERTLSAEGDGVKAASVTREGVRNNNWETGAGFGGFGNAPLLSVYGGYHFTDNLAAEIAISQALGSYSDNLYVNASLANQPFPSWRISPFVSLGIGWIQTTPRAALATTQDRDDEMLSAGLGVRWYWTQRYFLRCEYRNYVVLTSRNENESVNEWKLGLSAFF